jgi:hypothetical protein
MGMGIVPMGIEAVPVEMVLVWTGMRMIPRG